MSDLVLDQPAVAAVPAKAAAPIYRAATRADLPMVLTRLHEAIATSPFYNDDFKAYESGRLTLDYLQALHEIDPHHVIIIQHKGAPAGFMISGPELGTLWLYWSYLFPENRRSTLAVQGMAAFVKHWDNGRFHKIATYTKTGNEPAAAIMRRYGYEHTATLKQHIFGEDYLLYERFLSKTTTGYDHGARLGLKHRLRRRLQTLLGR